MSPAWWETESLVAGARGLALDGVDLAAAAAETGTPCFVYSRRTVARQLEALHRALDGLDHEVLYAMKANRHPGVLEVVRARGDGIDACSPREVALALASGFAPERISFNAGMLSERDLAAVAPTGARFIVDSFSAIRRLGPLLRRQTAIGVRVDPGISAGYNARLSYTGGKLGFDVAELPAAVDAAREAGLRVGTLHAHLGAALREEDAEAFDATTALLCRLARSIGGATVNVGGGLAHATPGAGRPLRPARWAEAIRRHLPGVRVACEPGAFVAAPAGVLLVTVNTVERRRDRTWVGVDAGYSLHPAPALHGLGVAVIPVARPLDAATTRVEVAGNLNEPHDTWASDLALPPVAEGEVLAILPAGAYAEAMASDHCLRGGVASRAVG